MHMLRIVLLGWPCITSSAWILLWIYLQTSNAFKPILLLYVLQPTVVDKQQIRGEKRWEEEAAERLCRAVVWVLWECCLSIDSRAALLLTAYHHSISGECITCQTVGMPSVSLHCYVLVLVLVVLVIWLAFWRGNFGNGTYTKLITHPHSPFYY